jgi:hypothetical protein
VTKNGFDPAHLPTSSSTKDPNRIIHISRPERGLKPLLACGRSSSEASDATLQVCRYSSMYDEGGWGEVCLRAVRSRGRGVNAQVGGITYLGELNKRQLYQAISEAAVMWYPGVATFAETSCIAAVEAQACGTPFVGSLKGALPETARPSYDAGLLIAGDAEKDQAYHEASSRGARADGRLQRQSFAYRRCSEPGRTHVRPTPTTCSRPSGKRIESRRSRDATRGTSPRAAAAAARGRPRRREGRRGNDIIALVPATTAATAPSGAADDTRSNAFDFCDYVIAGKDQTAEHYGDAAIADPLKEIEFSGRFKASGRCSTAARACSTSRAGTARSRSAWRSTTRTCASRPRLLAGEHRPRHARGERRRRRSDRCTFERITVYDFDAQTLHE